METRGTKHLKSSSFHAKLYRINCHTSQSTTRDQHIQSMAHNDKRENLFQTALNLGIHSSRPCFTFDDASVFEFVIECIHSNFINFL